VSTLHELTAADLATRLARRELSARELTRAFLDRVAAVEPAVGAYLTLTPELALAEADAIDAARAAGEPVGPLAGVPLAVKDNLVTAGVRTTCASRLLEHWVPPYESTVTARLRQAGLVSLGKVNMDEFAMGSSCENSALGVTRNPWDLARVPGGSSGGSAAAVAAGEAALAVGTDTGGSIRQPAAFCGLVGMKPTYGLVSRQGLVAFASSLDQAGPITRDVRDNALLLGAMAGHDPLDSTSLEQPVPDYAAALERGAAGLRVGLVRELVGEGVDPEVRAAVLAAVEVLEGLGAHVEEVDLPHSRVALSTYYVVATAEASSNLARYDGVRYGLRADQPSDLIDMYTRTRAHFGTEVKRRILLGTYALAAGYYDAYYKKALQLRTLIKADHDQALTRCDVLLSPTTPTTAFRLGERVQDPLSMYLADVATIPANLAGLPALSLPCGFDSQGLPIGLQLVGRALGEEVLYQVAHAYEQAAGHHLRRPALGRVAAS
jgi:aspartyl-tRNA(Asn)/glutamyl-tRNA(Gln) amidotransferase subunit A